MMYNMTHNTTDDDEYWTKKKEEEWDLSKRKMQVFRVPYPDY